MEVRFQCRERLMGDCYPQLRRPDPLPPGGESPFQCRERLMGDCYTNTTRKETTTWNWTVSVPRTADGGLLLVLLSEYVRGAGIYNVSVPRTADGGLLLVPVRWGPGSVLSFQCREEGWTDLLVCYV